MAKKTRTIKTSKELNASVENSCAYAGFHPQMGWQPQRVNLQTMTTCQFFDEFIATRTPCIITSTLPGNINNWTSEYLCESAGHEQVQVEIRDAHGNFGSSQKRLHMTFAEFIDKLQSDDSANYYLTTQYDDSEISNQNKYNHTNVEKCHNLRQNETFRDTYPAPIPSLLNDIPMCPSIFKTLALQQINLWIGSSPSEIHGTTSGLHHDFADNLYILLRGRKRFTIFSPKDASAMYLHGDIDTMKTYNKKRKQYHKNKGQDGMHVHPNGLISYALGIQSDGAHICDVVNWRLEQTQNIYSKLQLEMQKESKSTLSDTQQDALMELENKIEQLEDELLRLQQIYGGDDLVDDFEMELDNSSDNDEKKSSKITKHQEIEQRREPLSFSRIPAYLLHDDLSPNLDCKNRNRQLEQQFPKIKAATRISFQLNQGEMLYLPASWFHEVTSFSTTNSNQQSFHMALNYWMHPPNTQSYDSPYESNYWHDQWQLLQDAMNKSQIYAQHSTQITSSIVNAQVSHADTRKRIITRKRLKRLQLKNRIIWRVSDTIPI